VQKCTKKLSLFSTKKDFHLPCHLNRFLYTCKMHLKLKMQRVKRTEELKTDAPTYRQYTHFIKSTAANPSAGLKFAQRGMSSVAFGFSIKLCMHTVPLCDANFYKCTFFYKTPSERNGILRFKCRANPCQRETERVKSAAGQVYF
jgi:hypothetical protein